MTHGEESSSEARLTSETLSLQQAKAAGIREWIATWPYTENDGTFLAAVARDGLAKAAAMEKEAP